MNDTKAILWLAVEDYAGLWEAVWQLRSIHPEMDEGQLLDSARVELKCLVEDGLVRLYHCQEPYGDLTLVEARQVGGTLADPNKWLEPEPGAESIRFSATPAGHEAYFSK